MKPSRDFTLTAIIFAVVAGWMSMNVQPVGWSIFGLVVVIIAVITSSVRAVVEYRRERVNTSYVHASPRTFPVNTGNIRPVQTFLLTY